VEETNRVDNGDVAMATEYTHVPAQASVSEVLKLVVHEHRELRAQYKEVSSRIRDLRIAVRTLRNLGGRSAGSTLREEHVDAAENAEPHAGETRFEGEVSQDLTNGSEIMALRRAVRIAVFETSGAVSNEEVYARILRRGSFDFPSQDFAERSIAEELNSMANQGELLRLDTATGSVWQRI
jgi:hypothetical protein